MFSPVEEYGYKNVFLSLRVMSIKTFFLVWEYEYKTLSPVWKNE
jgi:hypothetical protein